MIRLLRCALLAIVGSPTFGHGVPYLVHDVDGALAIQAVGETGLLLPGPGGIETDTPGFGVNLEAAGPPIGAVLGLEVVGGLMRWDGQRVGLTDAVLTIVAPDSDSNGTPVQTGVADYSVIATTESLTGMTWARYPGGSFWDADGRFSVAAAEASGPASGVFGVPVRLVDLRADAPLAPSEPFTLTWVSFAGLGDLRPNDGVEALRSVTEGLATPDFNRDGIVDRGDFDLWTAQYGLGGVFAADGDGDGRVTAADYTLLRDAALATSVAASELSGSLLTFIAAVMAVSFLRETSPCVT